MITPDWIAADWGQSQLQVWAIQGTDTVLASASTPLTPGHSDLSAVSTLIADWATPTSPAPVLLSGYDGTDIKPLSVPCPPPSAAQARTADLPPHPLQMLPDVIQDSPLDRLSSALIRVTGFLAQEPDFEGILCLPGALTRWVHLSAGEIVSFRSFVAGDLIAALTQMPGLPPMPQDPDTDLDHPNLLEAVRDGMAKPALLAARLAGISAEHSLNRSAQAPQRARLTGLVIGAELSAARAYWLGQDVAVVQEGHDPLAPAYLAALRDQSAMARPVDGQALALRGLCATRNAAS
jgi:2-dehydro-3-deoxygalactonokinase